MNLRQLDLGSNPRLALAAALALLPVHDAGAASPGWTLEGGETNASLGYAVAAGTDYDGDHYAELLAGAVSISLGELGEGAAFLFSGSPSGPVLPALWTGQSNQTGANFGRALAAAGDVNGDGAEDYLVGAIGLDPGGSSSGAALLYLGDTGGGPPATSPAWFFPGSQPFAQMGFSVAGLGDVNHDGFDDVAVGAPRDSHGQEEEGRVFVFYGSASGLPGAPSVTYEADRADARFGYVVAGPGDVNGDGFDDLAIASTWYEVSQRGRVFVYYGSAQGLPAAPSWSAAEPATVSSAPEYGHGLAGAGDVNGDGFDDLLVGGPYHSNPQQEEGIAALYLGSAAGLQSNPAWLVSSHHHRINGARFGNAVAGAGDYNGDGYDDLLIGAYLHGANINQQGAAFLYLGGADGPTRFPVEILSGEQGDSFFGWAVAGAGDVDGDGLDDLVVGAPSFSNGQSSEGKIYLYHGEFLRPIFFDGFESGDRSAWSQSIP